MAYMKRLATCQIGCMHVRQASLFQLSFCDIVDEPAKIGYFSSAKELWLAV